MQAKAPQDLKPITLPKPDMDGGKSVLAALKERKTTRNISTKELPAQSPIKPALGCIRSEPGKGLIRQTRQDRRVGEQLAGDRFVCGSARRRVSVRSDSSPADTRCGRGSAWSGGPRGSGVSSGEYLLSSLTSRDMIRDQGSRTVGSETRKFKSLITTPIPASSRPTFICSRLRKG